MASLLAERPPPRLFVSPEEDHDGGAGAGPTLDGILSGAWEGLAAHAAVACPLCAGEMRPRYGAGATPLGGRCADCGTSLE